MLLPASVHMWFSDLRDRSTSQKLEAYTVSTESPSLLMQEMLVLQVRYLCAQLCDEPTRFVS